MSKVTKWKPEKAKVKAVFRLQFHATHIPPSGWDKLFVSFVAADSLKASGKTNKSSVRNGTCKWLDPIYETTRLLFETKTRQYDEKLYKLVVSMGSSRSSILGEANINLAEYGNASNPSSVTLPLHGCDYGTLLHVTVQLLTSKTGFREFEQQRVSRERGLTAANPNGNGRPVEAAEMIGGQRDKVNTRVRFKSNFEDLPSLGENVELSEDYADFATGVDGSSNTSESYSAEKHSSSTLEIDSQKSGISAAGRSDPSDRRLLTQGSNEWVQGWSSDYSIDNELAAAYDENSKLRESLEVSKTSLLELKLEVNSLRSQADALGAETQKFTQLLSTEVVSAEKLAEEVFLLKSECIKTKSDFEHLKQSKLNPPIDSTSSYRQRICDLEVELEESKAEHVSLITKMNEMESYYEALIHNLEETQKQMIEELQNLKYEHSTCLYTISSCESQMEKMHENMSHQLLQLSEERRDVESLNKVLEGRAVAAETTLKGARWNYSMAVDQLQKDLELLSLQVLSMFETNENLIKQAFADTTPKYFDCVEKNSEADSYLPIKIENVLAPHQGFSLQKIISKKNAGVQGDVYAKKEVHRDLDNPDILISPMSEFPGTISQSMLVSLEHATEELSEMLVLNLYSDVFSKVLQETLVEAVNGAKTMKEKIDELAQLLGQSIESKEMLMLDIKAEKEFKTDYINKWNKLASENHILEEKWKGTTNENGFLRKKITETERIVLDYTQETVEKLSLQKELRSLQIELEALNKDFDEQVLIKQNLQRIISSLIVKFGFSQSVIVSYGEKEKESFLVSEPFEQVLDYKNFSSNIITLGELHKKIYEKNLQDSEEKKDLMKQRDLAQERLSSAESKVLFMKQKYESDIQSTITKLDVSDGLVEKLQIELTSLEGELHEATSENANLSKKIETLKSVNEGLETSKFTLVNTSRVNQTLLKSLQAKNEEFLILSELQNKTNKNILRLTDEKKELEKERDVAQDMLRSLESEVLTMKKEYESEMQTMMVKLEVSSTLVHKLQLELKDVADKLTNTLKAEERYAEQFKEISSKLSYFEAELQRVTSENMDLAHKLIVLESVNEELETTKLTVLKTAEEHQALLMSVQVSKEESVILDELQKQLNEKNLHLSELKKDLEEQKKVARGDIQNMVSQLDESNALVAKLELELKNVADKITLSSETEERYEEQVIKIATKLAFLEVEIEHVTTENKDLAKKIVSLESVKEELENTKCAIVNSTQENQALLMSLQAGYEESVNLLKELSSIKEILECTRSDLHREKSLRVELEGKFTHVTSQLNEQNGQLLSFEKEKIEHVCNKQLVSDLEFEKSKLCQLLVHMDDNLRQANEKGSVLTLQVTELESHLAAMYQYFLASDAELVCTRSQYQTRMYELVQQLETLDRCYTELHLQHLDVLTTLNLRISGEAQYIDESERLSEALKSLKSELEAAVTEKAAIMEGNKVTLIELEEYKIKATVSDTNEVETLKHMLVSSEKVVEILTCTRLELEIMVTLLKGKMDDQRDEISLVTHELSEQILKTKEFKDLSVHLKELKEQANAECRQAREKKQNEGPSESLRMAFIREQCEAKVQELRNQLFVSTKHREEMLLSLQNALDEVENLKKSEASHIDKKEELSLRILELEFNLQKLISDNRERVKACDEMKAELECSLISLECCKEEKRSLEASLHDCIRDRTRISDELSLLKKQVQSSASAPSKVQEDLQASLACLPSKAQSLMSSMNQLHKEFERLKTENLGSLPNHENHLITNFHGLERELLQLQKANEQLGRIFPLFNQFFDSGNALERVLALELELAESLQAKKSNIHIQSSFLKQHSDEEAIFQSFRDINELIKDMLELKGRYVVVETELKEMHDRYSQLSLQFAEVEGEREKLVMTLKNTRIPKRSSSYLFHSSSANIDDNL